jgi:NADPH:quinone reductase-like Zn-dependent oxidoreductase
MEVPMAHRQNHRIVVTERGGPQVLKLIEEDLPEPGRHDARVRVTAAGVSAYDLLIRSIWFPGNPKPPFTPGEDIVGVIDAIGADVTDVEVGRVVAGWTFGDMGGYSEYVCGPADRFVTVPEGLDPADAVSMVVNYLTAHLYLHQTAEVQPGESILVHGAAGGLGSALVQLGGLAGLEMYGTASAHNQEVVAALGATPIDYRNEDFLDRLRELTGDGVDVVFDTVSGSRQLCRSYRAVRKGGRLVPIGSVAVNDGGMKVMPLSLLTLAGLKLIPDSRRVPLSPNMMKYPQAHPDWYRDTLTELLDLAADGTLEPVVMERIPLVEAARAHELLEHGRHAGKIVLAEPGPDHAGPQVL